ncbi:PilN family type IVB pilus formation outer membrane protein [Cupriavidus pauculus]|uniref:PilN family type IVB pilus formation outer membrane protein n=1 Tax=Burkholderiaceae TaxID=119060 RepID=UPI00068E9709|nr:MULTISPECIES: PilN family type IVB pilus formation outer membrane protein [Burkholderiaceae]MCM3609251.1 PilN family type IVB pilus formation outer membrane protein [Cupriavidus pauculus]
MNSIRFLVASAAAVAMVGCTSIQNINDTMKRGEDTAAEASQITAEMQRQRPVQRRDTVVFSDEPIVSLKPLRMAPRKSAAEGLNCTVSFAPAMPVDILEFGQTITKLCGIPVRVTPDALAAVSGQFAFSTGNQNAVAGGQVGPAIAAPTVGQPLPPLPAMPGATGSPGALAGRMPGASLAATANLISNIKWNDKPVEGLLDVVTSRLGLSWRREAGAVSIFYLDTKTFSVYAIPSQTDMTSVVQSGTTAAAGVQGASGGPGGGASSGGGISGTSGSTQSTSVTNKSSITADIVANISSMLTPNVGRMTRPVNSGAGGGGFSTGTITVTDTPEVLARIENYLQGENKNITKQVLLNVKVLSVTLSDKESLGIDWTLVYKSLNGNYGFALKNLFQADSAAVNGAVSILDTATGRAGQFAGSSLIVQALSQQGRVSTITSPSVTTLNLQPVPVQVARQTSYLASVQTTNTAQVGSTTALTPGTVTTGFNMNLLPYVMPDNNLLLQYSINLSALQRLRSVTSGGSTIEIPEVDNRIFSQKVRLKSGETLVLSGFEQSIDNGNKQGVGNPNNILLGGGMGTDNRRDVIVVLITPVVMD